MTDTKRLKAIHRTPQSAAKQSPRGVRIALWAVFASYLASMAILLVLRGYQIPERDLILTPFQTIRMYFTQYDWRSGSFIINILGNIVTFVPLGLCLQLLLKHKSIFLSVGITALASILAETLQYVFIVGHTDIDDVILNTLGGLLGVLLYRAVRAICKTPKRTEITSLVLTVLMCLFIWPMAFQQLQRWGM